MNPTLSSSSPSSSSSSSSTLPPIATTRSVPIVSSSSQTPATSFSRLELESKPIQDLDELLEMIATDTLSPLKMEKTIKDYKHLSLMNPWVGSGEESLSVLLQFIATNTTKVTEPLILDLLLWQLARLRLFHHNEKIKKHENPLVKSTLSKLLSTASPNPLPPHLRCVLQLFYEEIQDSGNRVFISKLDRETIRTTLRKAAETHPPSLVMHEMGEIQRDRTTRLKAVDLAALLDGNNNRVNSLRALLHRSLSNDPLTIIKKQLAAFQSVERTFIFERGSSAPIENYKVVMLYIIDSLQHDRDDFYRSNPDYIDESILQQYSEKMERDGYVTGFFDTETSRYPFEWAARQLVPLRDNIENAASVPEIRKMISKFQDIYRHLVHADINITVCSCIDPSVFNLENEFKPILFEGIPKELLEFGFLFGIIPKASTSQKEIIISPFSRIGAFAYKTDPGILKLLDTLERNFRTLLDKRDRESMQQFLQTWSQIPSLNSLITDNDSKLFFQDIENKYFGFNHKDLESIRWQQPLLFENTPLNLAIKAQFNIFQGCLDSKCLNPTDNPREQLLAFRDSLQQIINNPEFAEAIDNHSIKDYFKSLTRLLSREPAQSYTPYTRRNRIPLHYIKEPIYQVRSNLNFALMIPEILDCAKCVKQLLESTEERDISYLNELTNRLIELKNSVQNHLINQSLLKSTIEQNSVQAGLELISIIDQFLLIIGEEIAADQTIAADFKFSFFTKIAQALYYFDDLPQDPISLKHRLEDIQQGYVILDRYTKEHFANLPPSHRTYPGIVKTLQGSCNTEIGRLLSTLINQSDAPSTLNGYCTQPAEIVGKVRFISPETDVSSIQEGDILVTQYLPNQETLGYEKAAAIISAEGGMFSHAAIIFSEIGIPALTGASILPLSELEGKFIYLNLSESSYFHPLSSHEATIIENSQLQVPSKDIAQSIEELSGKIKQTAYQQFYSHLFNKLSPIESEPFLEFPSAQSYLQEKKETLISLKRMLWSTANIVQQSYLLAKISHLQELLYSLKAISLEEIVELNGTIASLNIQPIPNRFAEQSGKLENLNQLKEVVESTSSGEKVSFEIPFYTSFQAKELIWSQHPALQEQVTEIVTSSSQEVSSKSSSIATLLQEIPIDGQVVLSQWSGGTPWIVRSSSKLEDQAASSGAGIFDSVPGSDLKDIGNAFRQVLTSGFSDKALCYLTPEIAPDKLFEMQFILQNYIADAEFSGVAFSVRNENQWDVAALQVVKGVGGGVEGSQTPSYFFFDTKEDHFITIDAEVLPCQTEIAKEICRFVKGLERHFGTAVEIEFAGKGDRIYVVQVRPITRFAYRERASKS